MDITKVLNDYTLYLLKKPDAVLQRQNIKTFVEAVKELNSEALETVAVDGVTITGDGTTSSPLKAVGGGFITAIGNTATIGLTVTGTTLTADFASLLISQFTNDSGYITGVTSGNLTEATSSILTITGGTNAVLGSGTSIQVKQSSAVQDGYLSSTDWSTFNSKLTSVLASANIFVGSAGNVATAVAMSSEATIANTGAVTLTNSAVIGKVITGYVSGAGTVAATDTLLQAIQKLNGNTAALVTGVSSVFGRTGAVTAAAADYSGIALTGVTSLNGLVVTANTGAITTGSWGATNIPLNKGGTNAALTASNGGIFYSTASAGAILAGNATASKMLLSGASTTPTWSTSTIPTSAGGTALKWLRSDGTNYILSTSTLAEGGVTSGKSLISDGTNWIASTVTKPNSATTGDLLYASASNVYSNLADVATGNALISSGVSIAPSWGKIGLGTHVSGTLGTANGGTGMTGYIVGGLIYAQTTTVLAELASSQPIGSVLMSGGVNLAPFWSTTIFPNSCSGGDIVVGTGTNTYGNIAGVALGQVLISQGLGNAPAYSGTIKNTTGDAILDINNVTFGDVSGAGANSKLVIDDSNLLVYVSINTGVCLNLDTQNHIYKIGDVGALSNGAYLVVDDANNKLNFIGKIGGSNGACLNLDCNNNIYQIGDISGFNNNTFIQIDDVSQKISFIANVINANLAAYANDAAAGVGGLVAGDLYQTSGLATLGAGVVMIKQ